VESPFRVRESITCHAELVSASPDRKRVVDPLRRSFIGRAKYNNKHTYNVVEILNRVQDDMGCAYRYAPTFTALTGIFTALARTFAAVTGAIAASAKTLVVATGIAGVATKTIGVVTKTLAVATKTLAAATKITAVVTKITAAVTGTLAVVTEIAVAVTESLSAATEMISVEAKGLILWTFAPNLQFINNNISKWNIF
jgi:hypothetical protein